MKKLLTLCLLVATAFTIRAQEMSFEETVKYINEKIACCSGIKDWQIKATLSGDISWANGRINLFDLVSKDFSGMILQSNGIDLSTNSKMSVKGEGFEYSAGNFYITFNSSQIVNVFVTQADAERIYRALLHLRSKCIKVKDPFDK